MTTGIRQNPSRSLSPEEISRRAETCFGEPVVRITAPGGRGRDSVRVHFKDRSVIATYRHRETRLEREIAVLQKLHQVGAPVPELLAVDSALLFQSDLGSRRLGTEMQRRGSSGQAELAQAAFDSLWTIKRAARDTGLTSTMPPVGSSATFVARFATAARRLSDRLAISAPKADWSKLSTVTVPVPRHFVKWDARSGNAAIQADGQVMWFDWEHAGRRHGIEDFGFLIADEFWPLGPEDSFEVFARTCPGDSEALLPHLIRFSTLQAVERLALIQKEHAVRGWTEKERAQRYDRMGAVPELVSRLAQHGSVMALLDPLTMPMATWFDDAAAAILAADGPDQSCGAKAP